MNVNHNASLASHELPGLVHQTLAGARDGLRTCEVWRQTIAPHAATPVHRHDCEEVIVVFSGAGVCHCEGAVSHAFKADDTLVIPPNVVHQICNTSDTPLEIMAMLAMAPVQVETADGAPLPLPWDHGGGRAA